MVSLLRSSACMLLILILSPLVGCSSSEHLSSSYLQNPPPPTFQAPNMPTAIPITTSSPIPSSMARDIPSWKGITPGHTSREEVIQILGAPTITQTYERLEFLSYYPRGLDSFLSRTDSYNIMFQDGIVQRITVGEGTKARWSEFVRRFGTPETRIQYTAPRADVYIFASQGIAALANQHSGALWATVYFVPTTTQEYLNRWGQYYPEDRPFPNAFPGHPIEAGITPGKSTRQDVIRLYGDPDYVGPLERLGYLTKGEVLNEAKIMYIYRVPSNVEWEDVLGGDAFVTFVLDDQEVVQLVHVQGNLHPEYKLKDIFAKYGEPHWIYDWTGPAAQLSPAVYFYPEKGVSVVGVSHDFRSKPDDWLRTEWFYPPMSWDQYWKTWGAEPRSGFQRKFEGELRKWTGFSTLPSN